MLIEIYMQKMGEACKNEQTKYFHEFILSNCQMRLGDFCLCTTMFPKQNRNLLIMWVLLQQVAGSTWLSKE